MWYEVVFDGLVIIFNLDYFEIVVLVEVFVISWLDGDIMCMLVGSIVVDLVRWMGMDGEIVFINY